MSDCLEFEADSRDIGRIIGTKGVNIRALEIGSKCKIKTPAKDSEDTTVRITGGNVELRKRCKEAIDGVLMGDEPQNVFAEMDGAGVLKNLDPTVLNYVARHKNEFEGKFNVVLVLETKSVHVWATKKDKDPQATVQKAKEGIQYAIDDLQTSATLVVRVPANQVNSIINDTSLRQLQDGSGMQASVMKDDEGTGIRLVGLSGAIDEGRAIIEKLARGEGADSLGIYPGMVDNMPVKAWYDFERDYKSLEEHAGVSIEFEPSKIKFIGDVQSVDYAKGELMNILQYYFPRECTQIKIDYESVDFVAGEDDRMLMRLQAMGAHVSLDRKNAYVWVSGRPREVESVTKRVNELWTKWASLYKVIELRNRDDAFRVIGAGGSTVRAIQDETGAKIEVITERRKICITGSTEANVQDALDKVLNRLGRGYHDWYYHGKSNDESTEPALKKTASGNQTISNVTMKQVTNGGKRW